MRYLFLTLAGLLLSADATFGQACCSGGTPLAGSLGLQYFEKGVGFAELSYDFNTQSDLVSGNEEIDDNPRRRNTHSLLLRGGYAFSERWTFIGLFSVVQQEEVTTRVDGNKDRIVAKGVGDAVAFFQYDAINNTNYSLLLGAGLEVPAGVTNRANPETRLPLHPDLQPGRGAWSFLGGARFTLFHTFRPTMSYMANITFRLTTPASRYDGLQQYEFGNEFRLLSGFADRFFIGQTSVDPSLLVLYRFTTRDKANGIEAPNTGGHWLHLRPGFEWGLSPFLQLGAFVEFPVYRNLRDVQLTTSTRARISVRYAFQLGEQALENPKPFQ